MLRGLGKLTWIEIKVFLREPLGAFGSIGIPVLLFIVLSRVGNGVLVSSSAKTSRYILVGLPVFVAVLIVVSAVVSLVTIIAIYREGGILKRLRATPLRPQTILSAHVIVKLSLTAATLALLVLVGKSYSIVGPHTPVFSFTLALLMSTWSILSIGFLIASIVPTARFAQPIGALVLYPMIAISALFVPDQVLPPALHLFTRVLPLTYAVPLMQGIWNGDAWLAHSNDVVGLVALFLIYTALSAKLFRWE
jgi:ABC-2 type transport system permease protein